MHKTIVSVIAVILIIFIYNLPKVVVDNDSTETGIGTATTEVSHDFEMSAADSLKINDLSNKISSSGNNEKNTIFADSLANLYLTYNKLDSAEKYAQYILSQGQEANNYQLAGDIFFKAFGFSKEQSDVIKFSKKAASCFEKVLETDSDNPDAKAKLAMTLVSSATPMQGIMMLREVLAEYPKNETALYNLGILSMQSGQYDKAVERFEKLIEVNAGNVQAYFYLGVSYFELKQKDKASELFNRVKELDDDPAIIQAADGYLKEINNF
ncbi:MAG: tetratricopeptide (TPR) repeat protein [Cyclobacteriaceae bacterium]|jgi:tetratricopeptide (TPR) repeat protein